MTKILLLAEHDGTTLNPATAKALTGAQGIGAEIHVVVFAEDPQSVADQASRLTGVTRVLAVTMAAGEHTLAAALAPRLVELIGAGYSHLLAPSTTTGKDVMPRVAGLLGVAQVSDIMAIEGPYTFQRPIYAGNAIVTVEAPSDQVLVGTIRTASFSPAAEGGSATVEATRLESASPGHTRFRTMEASSGDRPDLQSAQVVVAGGRALGSSDGFEIIYQLADALKAGVGASRAAVDAGYVPNDMQIGQTGKIISPDLYFAIGISGAIQHLTGIKDAGTIVAINKDPDAPIFEVADIGLVGDLFELVPQLTERLGGG